MSGQQITWDEPGNSPAGPAIKWDQPAKHALPAPSPAGLANKELAKSGIQVGPLKAPAPVEMKPSRIGQVADFADRSLTALKNVGPQQAASDNPADLVPSISKDWESIKSIPRGLHDSVMDPAQWPATLLNGAMYGRPAMEGAAPAARAIGSTLERNAAPIGKAAGYGAGVATAAEELYHGRPLTAALSLGVSPRIARIGESAAGGTGRLFQRLGYERPDAPYAPVTGPLVHEGEYVPSAPPPKVARPDAQATAVEPRGLLPESASVARDLPYSRGPGEVAPEVMRESPPNFTLRGRPKLLPAPPPVRDVIAANPGERGLQMARGARMSEPMVLPSESRGLMLPERGGLVPRGVRSPDPTSRLINSISQQAVRGAGGAPETPVPPTPGKPIVSRPTPPPAVQNLAQDVPEMIPANSSALKGYHYDASKQVMTVETRSGGMYRYAEVTPDEFRAFEDNDSTGKAFHELKNNHVQTEANYGKGWIRKIPSQRSSEAPAEGGLVSTLEESIRRARTGKK